MNARRWLLLALVALAFAVRIGFQLADPHPARSSDDASRQAGVALAILDAGKWGMDDRTQPVGRAAVAQHRLVDPADLNLSHHKPDYEHLVIHTQGVGIIMAGVWGLTGDRRFGYMSVLQIVIASLLTLAVYWIAATLFRRPRAGYIAAGLYAVYIPLAEFSRYVFYDPWAVFATIAIVALFVKAIQPGSRWPWLVALGVAVGAGANMRSQALVLLPVLALAAIPLRGARWAATAFAVALLAALPFVLPWTIRNAVVYHAFVPMQTGFGQVMWQGFGELSDNPMGAVDNDLLTFQDVHRHRPGLVYETPAYDSYLLHRSLSAIAHHPLFYAKLLARRAVQSTIALQSVDWVGDRPAHRRPVLRLLARAIEPLTVLVGLLTLALTWKRFRRAHLVILAAILGVVLIPILIHYQWRYVAPEEFAWVILAALGVDLAIEALGRRRADRRHTAPVAA